MSVTPDIIASLVLQEYEKLPVKRKPPVRDNGIHEWVPLSGIVAEIRGNDLRCLSLATGMKCLPQAKLPLARGNVLHDWHAEVLAIRAFNRFVLDECKLLAEGGPDAKSLFIRRRRVDELQELATTAAPWCGQPFTWRDDVKLHMYCSEAPCGDASMELTMAAQADATPWEVPFPPTATEPTPTAAPLLPGRAYFQHLGVVRRKPARGDAPATLSKSCSDKLALRQCMSLLSSTASLLVSPTHAYLTTLILPASQHSATGCERAFSARGRMAVLKEEEKTKGLLAGGYRFAPFRVDTTDLEFAYSRRGVINRLAQEGEVAGSGGCGPDKMAASNLAVAWTASGLEEASLGGTLQGRKLFDPRGASFASRRKMWTLAVDIASMLGAGLVGLQKTLAARNYGELKQSDMLQPRLDVKRKATSIALKGWAKNEGDDDFSL
ncbi:hypothetical protein PG993_014465 [Apiospora rasikravindrae]|uniref:A to I editase domain-containing protein n=1 Tax=Apiospora rasikravindrae TaxID=990691 RepID=A0ABR1RMS3_9PEZI